MAAAETNNEAVAGRYLQVCQENCEWSFVRDRKTDRKIPCSEIGRQWQQPRAVGLRIQTASCSSTQSRCQGHDDEAPIFDKLITRCECNQRTTSQEIPRVVKDVKRREVQTLSFQGAEPGVSSAPNFDTRTWPKSTICFSILRPRWTTGPMAKVRLQIANETEVNYDNHEDRRPCPPTRYCVWIRRPEGVRLVQTHHSTPREFRF